MLDYEVCLSCSSYPICAELSYYKQLSLQRCQWWWKLGFEPECPHFYSPFTFTVIHGSGRAVTHSYTSVYCENGEGAEMRLGQVLLPLSWMEVGIQDKRTYTYGNKQCESEAEFHAVCGEYQTTISSKECNPPYSSFSGSVGRAPDWHSWLTTGWTSIFSQLQSHTHLV